MTSPRRAWLLCALPWALLALAGCRNLTRGAQPEAFLEGRALYLERIALPAGAQLELRLRSPAGPGGPGAILAEETRADIGQPPFAFRLPYDPARVMPGRVLRLEGEIRVDGRTWFHGARSLSSLAPGPDDEPLELRLHRVQG